MKTLGLLLLSMLVGMVTGAALAKPSADPHPLDGCTLEQRALVRIDAYDYVMDGSNPVEALQRARAEHCK